MKILLKNARLLSEYGFGQESVCLAVEDAYITYVGKEEPAGPFDRTVDCRENLVMPAFYNAHCHASMTIFRGYANGLPLHTWLNDKIFPAEERLNDERVYWGAKLAVAEMIRNGIASFSDMYMFEESVARAVAESGIKANLSRSLVSFGENATIVGDHRFAEAERLLKRYHESCDGKIRVDMSLHAEYTNTMPYCREVAAFAKEQGVGIQVHVSETEKEHKECLARHGLTPTAFLAEAGVLDVPVTAAHCVWLDESDLDIMQGKRVSIVHNPVSNLILGSGIMPLTRYLKKDINVALGTDGVASNNTLDVLKEMQIAGLLAKGSTRQADALSEETIIAMATVNGALAQGRTDCGKIREGFRADLILMDMEAIHNVPCYHLENAVAYSLHSSDVLMTMVDGRILFENGEYTSIDIEQLRFEFDRMQKHYFD